MNAQGIERAEIMGDWYEELNRLEEEYNQAPCEFCQNKDHGSLDCPHEEAPEQAAPTDEEIEAHYQDWLSRQTEQS